MPDQTLIPGDEPNALVPGDEPGGLPAQRPESLPVSTDVESLLRVAVENQLPVDQMRELLAMRRELKAEAAKEEYFRALSQLQNECPVIQKQRMVVDKRKRKLYKFAGLPDIIEVLKPLELKHGFSHRFDTEYLDRGAIKVSCIVTHAAGHSETTDVTIPATQGKNTNNAQNAGIMVTYGKRYSMEGAYGIATAETDTDGHGMVDDTPVEDADKKLWNKARQVAQGGKEKLNAYVNGQISSDERDRLRPIWSEINQIARTADEDRRFLNPAETAPENPVEGEESPEYRAWMAGSENDE